MSVDMYDLNEHWDECDGTDPTNEAAETNTDGKRICQVCANVGLALDELYERLVREGKR